MSTSKDGKKVANVKKHASRQTSTSSNKPLIIDVGSGFCKAGFADEEAPKVVLHNNGETYYPYSMDGNNRYATDWNATEPFYEHLYEELRTSSENHPVLLTESPIKSKRDREKLTSLMYEKFNVPALSTVLDATLSIYGSGRITGVVVDVGHSFSRAVSFCEGYVINKSIVQMLLGGRDLTDYLDRIMTEVGHYSHTRADYNAIENIKKKVGYVAIDYEDEINKPQSKVEVSYKLPDGRKIIVGNQRFRCAEPLFEPHMLGKENQNVPDIVYESVRSCEHHYSKDIYNNIVLVGGSTLFPGFVARMQKEITRLAPDNMKVGIIATDTRIYGAWLGGSVVSTLSSFKDHWITKAEYEEQGTSIIHKKHW